MCKDIQLNDGAEVFHASQQLKEAFVNFKNAAEHEFKFGPLKKNNRVTSNAPESETNSMTTPILMNEFEVSETNIPESSEKSETSVVHRHQASSDISEATAH